MKFLGNYLSKFDFDGLLSIVQTKEGERRSPDMTAFFNIANDDFKNIMDGWVNAGYNLSDIEWYNYYSGKQFSKEYADNFGKLFNSTPIKVWISEIKPAKSFPLHWDADTDTSKYIEGKMLRLHAYLENSVPGHFFILENEYHSDYQKGDVYEWSDYRVWHAGGNFGLKTKYQFNYLGFIND